MQGENSEIPKSGTTKGTTFSIIATGESAKDWVPFGYSIGVNDAWKWGKPTDALLICNRPGTFAKDRLQIILDSKPKEFYSHKADWAEWFPNWKRLRLHPWNGTLHTWPRTDGPSAYTQNTSPIIAITLAFNLGAKEIILWGVDFKNHHIYHESSPNTAKEVDAYLQVFEALYHKGVNVYRGTDGTAFDKVLPIYNNQFNQLINAD